ncbi:hypothetical protein NDU88_007685 [Pleurodeles waltl]|uniref:Uncharacterized protein n=1 Tax=Pleurodeles waltl TaxID=8319 RepID=A0AAV7RTJ6_PLEWA|nr:hypothetical protein NDU88_007685 [Pleurodeles waltl]
MHACRPAKQESPAAPMLGVLESPTTTRERARGTLDTPSHPRTPEGEMVRTCAHTQQHLAEVPPHTPARLAAVILPPICKISDKERVLPAVGQRRSPTSHIIAPCAPPPAAGGAMQWPLQQGLPGLTPRLDDR